MTMTTDPSYDEISEHARGLWQSRGQPEGQDQEIWLEAERQLRGRTPSRSESQNQNATLTDAAMASGKNQRKRGSSRSESKLDAGIN